MLSINNHKRNSASCITAEGFYAKEFFLVCDVYILLPKSFWFARLPGTHGIYWKIAFFNIPEATFYVRSAPSSSSSSASTKKFLLHCMCPSTSFKADFIQTGFSSESSISEITCLLLEMSTMMQTKKTFQIIPSPHTLIFLISI